MIKKFIDKKIETEDKIQKILDSFRKETGTKISYIEVKSQNSVGFNPREEFTTKIILKND